VSLGDAIELREDDTMKTLTTMMTLVASMILFSASASAQLPELPSGRIGFDTSARLSLGILGSSDAPLPEPASVGQRYDYSTGLQTGAGILGGFVGTTVGGVAGYFFGVSQCSGGGFSCLGAGIIEGAVGGIAFGTIGAAGAVIATGGKHQDGDDTFGAATGGLIGLVLAAPIGAVVGIGTTQFLRPSGGDYDTWQNIGVLVGTGITGLGAGLGASWGYQWGYNDSPVTDLALTPMLGGEHNGVVLSGRF
jgi:hypothetical protein